MYEHEFLNKYIFKELKNLNIGFDVESIKYFSSDDFKIVLQRVEQYGLGICGIEPWKDGDYYDCEVCESHSKLSTDPEWYYSVFDDFLNRDEELQYSASYSFSEKIRKDFSIIEYE